MDHGSPSTPLAVVPNIYLPGRISLMCACLGSLSDLVELCLSSFEMQGGFLSQESVSQEGSYTDIVKRGPDRLAPSSFAQLHHVL